MPPRTDHSRWKLFVCATLSLLITSLAVSARADEPDAPTNRTALIDAALNRPIGCDFKETPLGDVVKFLGEKLGVPVAINNKALDEVGLGSDTPVTIRLTGISAASALRLMLHQIDPGLTYSIEDGALAVTTREHAEENLETRLYDVADLTKEVVIPGVVIRIPQLSDAFPADGDTDAVIELITSTIEPTMWEEVGGPGSITAYHGILVVSQARFVHEKIAGTLSALRTLMDRHDSKRDELAPIDANPSSGKDVAKAFAKLLDGKGLQLSFKETPLEDVVETLGEATKKTVLLDRKALDEVGIGADTPVTFQLKGLTLRQELRWILKQIDPTLTYRIGDDALLITTREAAEENLRTLIYPVWDLVDDNPPRDYDSLIELMTRTIAPNSWDEVGGPGSIAEYLQVSCLVVSQTQEVHEQLQNLLLRLREIEKKRKQASKTAKDSDGYVVALYELKSSWNVPETQSGGGGGFFSASAERPDGQVPAKPMEEAEKLKVAEEIIPLVQQLIEPASWSADEVVIRPLGKNLLVRQRISIQRRVRDLLQSLDVLGHPVFVFGCRF